MAHLFNSAARVARLLALPALVVIGAPAQAAIVISQVYGGGGNGGATYTNDFVELHNTGTAAVAIDGWSLQYSSAAGTSWGNQKVALTGSIAAGGYYLIQMGSGGSAGAALPAAQATATHNMSATTGKLALVNSATSLPAVTCPADASIVDLVGYGTSANCSEGSAAPTPSATLSILRAAQGCTDTNNNSADFATGTPVARNSATAPQACGSPQPVVASCPSFAVMQGTGGSGLMTATSSTALVNGVTLLSGGVSGLTLDPITAATAVGGAASVRVQVASSVPTGSYALSLQFTDSAGQSGTCAPTVTVQTAAGYTPTYQIQGSGVTSPLLGQTLTTRGVVTAVLPGIRGFFLQDEAGDGNPLTSDGLFVFANAQAITVAVNDRIQVTGTVTEYAGYAGNPTVTELVNPSNIVNLGTGSITPTVVVLPEAAEGDLERYEGMLVTLQGPLTVSQNYFLGRYGQVTLSANGRLYKPTQVARPGTPAAAALTSDNARRRIILDDGQSSESLFSGVENPNPIPYIGADNTVRAGDTVASVTGVIDFGRNTSGTGADAIVDYKIHPTEAPVFSRAHPRSATPPTVGGTHRVASFNVLNFFTTFGDGTTAAGGSGAGCLPSGTTGDCRGADNAAEFTRQRTKIVQALLALDADVVGLMEIQRNGGVATQNLVDALNAAAGAGTWAAVPEPATGVGTDAIQVAMIYRPARVSLVGGALSDTDPVHNRPPLAQAFQALSSGQRFSVVVTHFKSKGCDGASGADADNGDGQGCWNSLRTQQAQALRAFLPTVQAAAGDAAVLAIGDYNAYAQEDPIIAMTGDALLADQVLRFDPQQREYSYTFDGEAGSLDHALATASAAQRITGVAHWHINTDEPAVIDYNTEFKPQDLYSATPYRSSDHDPVLIGLNLAVQQAQTISFTAPGDQVAAMTLALAASASSGLPVSFSSLTPTVCSVAGVQAQLLVAGQCTIEATQAGDAQFLAAAPVQRSFAVVAAPQTISFPAPPTQTLGSGPVATGASASSGLAVTLVSQTPAVCGIDGSGAITLLAAGTCTVQASQAGNATWAAAAPVSRSFTVQAAGAGGPDEGDVPLPAWALLLLAGLAGGVLRRHAR